MKGPKSNKEVIAGVTLLADRALAKAGRGYRAAMIDPLLEAIGEAKSFEGARQRLSAALVKRMDAAPVEEALSASGVQAGMIGDVAARPVQQHRRQRATGNGQQEEGTKPGKPGLRGRED
ncbi:MAG: hypothetical protein J5J06_05570 [Phycisphaerae bacterium]|nr:hypothetical protein [Phycisphaerae bacterium]